MNPPAGGRSSLRTPLGRARGLGAAGHGVGHWWAQRLSALALVPLGLWLVLSAVPLAGADHAQAAAWAARPHVAILLVLTIAALFWHLKLGVQVVIEDYVADKGARLVALIANGALAIVLAVVGLFAVASLAFGS